MIKKFFYLAFICALVGCQKDTVQLDSNKEPVTSYKHSVSGDLPVGVRDILNNGGNGHLGICETSTNRGRDVLELDGEELGVYAYPYTSNISPIELYTSALPCQPNIPYFIFSYVENRGRLGNTVTFHLTANPNYFDPIEVFDIDWELNGVSSLLPTKSFTVRNLQIDESNSVICRVFSTDNNVSIYSQEMKFDFKVLQGTGTDLNIKFESGYSYACMNTGTFPIVAP